MIKYKVVTFICFIAFFGNVGAQLSQEYINYKWSADSLYDTGNYASAVRFYRKICDLSSFIPRYDYYYASCCYIKMNQPDSALLYLEKGAEKGERFNSKNEIDSSLILMPLHKLQRWDSVRNLICSNIDKFENNPSRNDSLHKVLLKLKEKDQNIRLKIMHDSNWEATFHSMRKTARDSFNNEFNTNDKECEFELKKIISKFGWPGLKMVGSAGETAAWLIAQHSDLDTTFQVFCLKKMMVAILNYDSQLNNIAYLQDRVLVNEGKKQIYGTQFVDSNKKLRPRPIRDEKNVDKRRHAMELPSLETYLTISEKYFNSERGEN